MRVYYKLTTIDPIIVSQTTASTNNHECLDYIPGSAMLGALAGEHYANLTKDQSWQAFHNGQVKFGHCYPLKTDQHNKNGQIALPTPACWHYKKDEPAIVNGKYKGDSISNHTAEEFTRDANAQYKQCRDGYLTSQGITAQVEQSNTTKTALNSNTGSAEDGQLFSYSYLHAGQSFIGWLDSEDQTLLEKLKVSLNKTLHIGRSRNTEFGRVKVELIEVTEPALKTNTLNQKSNQNSKQSTNQNTKELVLWCLSDCEFINELGMPTLTPQGKYIHPQLSEATLVPARSFIRANRVSRFNQKRQGFDSEQILVAKGSVLVFKLTQALNDELLTALNQGIGINQQVGLGWVSVNPQWATQEKLSESELFSAYQVETQPIQAAKNTKKTASSPLTQWLTTQITQQEQLNNTQETVNALAIALIKLYQNARRYNSIINSNEAGPSSTQWSRIRAVVSENNSDWHKTVFTGDQAICKVNNDELGWGIKVQSAQGQSSFATEVEIILSKQSYETMRLLIEQLGRYDLSVYKDLKKAQQEFPEGVEA